MTEQPVDSLELYPTDENEICTIAKSFKNNKAPGLDEYSPKIIKNVISYISEPLCHIFNQSMLEGIFPDELKKAKVTPVFKSGDKRDFTNYRPISVLPVFSKLLERIIYKRTIEFFNKHSLLYEGQFGFRTDFSTSMALTSISNKIVDAFEKNEFALGVFIDLSKAFDTINHAILLSKLNRYGIRGAALDFFSSYLDNRLQCTRFGSFVSDFKTITCGIPQGSLLGPLLFIIYINDLYKSANDLSFILYADDTNIVVSNPNLESLCNIVNRGLSQVCEWFKANKLSINVNKCNYMIFHNGKRFCVNDICIRIDNTALPRVDKTKFLGVYLDSSLSWKYHISEVESKVSKSIGIISKIKHLLPDFILRMLYCALVLPYLNYCNLIWANTYKTNLQKIIGLQKKIIRIISRAQFNDHTTPLFEKLKLLKFTDINLHQQSTFMYKSINNIFPTQFNDKFCFQRNSEIHNYNTRSASQIHLPQTRTQKFQFDIRYSGPKYWNSLPTTLQDSLSFYTFSRKVKKKLISSYKKKQSDSTKNAVSNVK